MAGIGSKPPEGIHEKCGGGHTVHVVIAVDRDQLIVPDRMLDAVHCSLHAGHLEWIGIEARHGPHEGARLLVIGQSTVEQDLFEDGRKPDERFFCLRSNG